MAADEATFTSIRAAIKRVADGINPERLNPTSIESEAHAVRDLAEAHAWLLSHAQSH